MNTEVSELIERNLNDPEMEIVSYLLIDFVAKRVLSYRNIENVNERASEVLEFITKFQADQPSDEPQFLQINAYASNKETQRAIYKLYSIPHLSYKMSEIAQLLKHSPPGEHDVIKRDILEITQNNNSVLQSLNAVTEEIHASTPSIVTVDGLKTVVSPHNKIDNNTFFTHGLKPKKFKIDHSNRKTETLGDYEDLNDDVHNLQSELDKYLKKFYTAESVGCVFNDSIIIIGRKLSPQNFFNGQITNVYEYTSSKVRGTLRADIHYFEEGNVRLQTNTTVDESCDDVIDTISKLETDFERELNQDLLDLNEKEFKQIRRQLPVTRQPMDWDKAINGFNIGKDLESR